ncbi:MAG: aminopeptidase P family protein [Clostridia bacterium]|nr:aminopeptidase P family protein [Clostridia bacterium]
MKETKKKSGLSDMSELFGKMKKASETEFDGILAVSETNRRYASKFYSSDGYVFMNKNACAFITDFRYFGAAEEARKKGLIPPDTQIILQDKDMWNLIKRIAGDGKRILYEEDFLTVNGFEKIREKLSKYDLVPGASALFEKMRAQKDENEIKNIKKAQKITDKAFEYIVNFISDNLGRDELTEERVALEIEYFMRKNGASGIAFDTIAVSGKKTAMPHGAPDGTKIKKGFLTLDFGAKYNGYCSDMTRTLCIGKPTGKMKDVYDTVLCAQSSALEYISAGKTGKQIDAVARNYIAKRGYDGTFGHALGHSLGLEIHEKPTFSPSCPEKIPENAVLSVEPGIYIPGGFGVRIEDIVRVTQKGCENLTQSGKELLIL